MMIPDEKCTSVESWLIDTLFVPGQEPWNIDPTPEPEMSPAIKQDIEQQVRAELMQAQAADWAVSQSDVAMRLKELVEKAKERIGEEARKNDAKAETVVKDKLEESGWKNAMLESIDDLSTYPAAFIAGPVYRVKPTLKWDQSGNPIVERSPQMEFEWVSSHDIYPSPNSKGIDDGWLFRRHRLTRSQLYNMIGVQGYDEASIRTVLEDHGRGGLSDWLMVSGDSERKRLENRDSVLWDPDSRIDALQWWGSVQGLYLLEAGMDPGQIPDPLAEYNAELWLIGNCAIKCELNGDPLGRKGIYKTCFRNVAGSFWGKSPCDIITDKVDACNAAARSLLNNMAIASGPQVGVDQSKNPGGHDYSKMHPWKVWNFDLSDDPGTRLPLWFFQPNALVNELMGVYQQFSSECDNVLGIPKYASGSDSSTGALDTATGVSILQNNLLRGIKRIVTQIDKGWIEPSVRRVRDDMLLYDRKEELLRGDCKLVASGASAMVAREQNQVRRNEFLQLLLNPTIAQIAGPLPIIEVLRSIALGIDIDMGRSLPTKEQILQQQQAQQQAAMMQQTAQAGGQVQQVKPAQVNGAGNKVSGQDFKR